MGGCVLGNVHTGRAVTGRATGPGAEESPHASLAGSVVPPRCHLRRRGHQLRRVLRGGLPDRAVSAARRRLRDGGRAAGGGRLRPARLPAGRDAGSAVRIPRARAVRPGPRPPLQLGEAAARPVRQGDERRHRLGRGGLRLPVRPARLAQRPGLRPAHDDLGRGQPVLRLGRRPRAAHRLPPHRHLRGPRQGPDDDPPGPARGDPRHLRGARPPVRDQPSGGTRGDHPGADAGAPVHPGPPAGGRGAGELLGLQHHRLLRPAPRVLLAGRPRPAGAGVQDGGTGAAPGRASR